MLKDEKLDILLNKYKSNIARYVSLAPTGEIRYNNTGVVGDLKEIIIGLLKRVPSVNIRSFSDSVTKGNTFIYGKTDINEILDIISQNCKDNKYSIVNETISVEDGGVSGVVVGNLIEFSPNDTPRCVEKEGVCSLPKQMGYSILEKVYGFKPEIIFPDTYRVEFSIHPNRVGLRGTHTIIWEYEEVGETDYNTHITWSNNFSKHIGDKTYGLLVANYLGFNIPYTTVINRNVAPFSFGKDTGLYEKWIRTAPIVKESGRYYTGDRWLDPFNLMITEEQKGDNEINIASILSQSAVKAVYSGGAIKNKTEYLIEGVHGKGDNYMLGVLGTAKIPSYIEVEIKIILDRLQKHLDTNLSIEWVYDGTKVWLVQLNLLKETSNTKVIVAGNVSKYIEFRVEDGLEKLRILSKEIKGTGVGIMLNGKVGVCSHFGDILRQNKIPSFIKEQA